MKMDWIYCRTLMFLPLKGMFAGQSLSLQGLRLSQKLLSTQKVIKVRLGDSRIHLTLWKG